MTCARPLRREFAALARSRWDLALVTLAPLLVLVLLGALFFAGSARHLPIAVVDADNSNASRQLLRNLQASAQVQVAARPADLNAAWPLARSARVWAVVYVPEHLERDILAGHPASVLVYRNSSYFSLGALASRGIGEAVAGLNAQLLPQRLRDRNLPAVRIQMPRVQPTVLFNPQLSYEWFLEALLQPGILHVLMSCVIVVAIGRELEGAGGARAWVAAAGGGVLPALASKLAPYVLIFTAWQIAGTAWLAGWQGWGVHGSLVLLLAGQLALYACYAAIAAVVALALRDTYVALSAVALYGGPAITFSDATLPVLDGPIFTQVWSQVLPFTAYVKLQMEQMFMGSPAGDSMRWLGLLALEAVVLFAVALLLLRLGMRRAPAAEAAS